MLKNIRVEASGNSVIEVDILGKGKGEMIEEDENFGRCTSIKDYSIKILTSGNHRDEVVQNQQIRQWRPLANQH